MYRENAKDIIDYIMKELAKKLKKNVKVDILTATASDSLDSAASTTVRPDRQVIKILNLI